MKENSWREGEEAKYKIVRGKFGKNRVLREIFLRIHQSWLFVGLLLGIVVGTVVALVFRIEFFASGVWILFVIILGIIGYFFPSKFFVGIMILCGIILASVRTAGDLEGSRIISGIVGEKVSVSGKVLSDPDVEENTTKVQINQLKINETEVGGTLYINISTSEKIERGDIVEVQGEISEGFGSFSGSMYRPNLEKVSKPEPKDFFLEIRDWFAGEVRKYIPEREANLGLAYLLGMKNGLDNELIEVLKIVGLTHIVVASGTHLGIITGFTKKSSENYLGSQECSSLYYS